ncbi:MAG: 6-phosphogluconolactonase [Acidobacteria bacterium]|nr:6-phosphogluconolactonase [Acidobacteriota bacterium]
MARGELIICKDPDSVAEKAAEFFVSSGLKSIGERGRFNVVLSGGSTPKLMFARLAAILADDPLPLDKIYFFFGDERMVPVTSEESNFRSANELLLKPIGVRERNIFRFRTELEPDAAAADYSRRVRGHFGIESGFPSSIWSSSASAPMATPHRFFRARMSLTNKRRSLPRCLCRSLMLTA